MLIELSDAVRESLFAEMQESEIIGAVEHLATPISCRASRRTSSGLLQALDREDRTEVQTVS